MCGILINAYGCDHLGISTQRKPCEHWASGLLTKCPYWQGNTVGKASGLCPKCLASTVEVDIAEAQADFERAEANDWFEVTIENEMRRPSGDWVLVTGYALVKLKPRPSSSNARTETSSRNSIVSVSSSSSIPLSNRTTSVSGCLASSSVTDS
jgi:hypothetical protein